MTAEAHDHAVPVAPAPASARRAGVDTLRSEGVCVHFGGVKAVDGVDLVLHRDEILGLIGPNGAGKTTFVNAMTGFQRPQPGRVFLDDAETTRWSPPRLARAGVVRTFQSVRPYPRLSVVQNLELGGIGVGMGKRKAAKEAQELLAHFELGAYAEDLGEALPHGVARRLGVARALAARPRFLLLDEPAAGMNEPEADELTELLRDVHRTFACGLLLIEHDMRVIMGLCDRVQVLDHGQTIAVGTPAEVRADPVVLDAYLGHDAQAEGAA